MQFGVEKKQNLFWSQTDHDLSTALFLNLVRFCGIMLQNSILNLPGLLWELWDNHEILISSWVLNNWYQLKKANSFRKNLVSIPSNHFLILGLVSTGLKKKRKTNETVQIPSARAFASSKKKKNHTKEAIILNIIPESDHSAGMKKNGLCNLRRPFSSHE